MGLITISMTSSLSDSLEVVDISSVQGAVRSRSAVNTGVSEHPGTGRNALSMNNRADKTNPETESTRRCDRNESIPGYPDAVAGAPPGQNALHKKPLGILAAAGALLSLSFSALAADESKLVNARALSELQIPIVYSAAAEAVSLQSTTISSEIEARVLDILAQAADEVREESVLVHLDCRDYQLRLKQEQAETDAARAQLTLARQRLNRSAALIDRKHVSQDVLDQQKTELDAAQANLESRQVRVEQAQTDMSRCTIRSPFRAAVTRLYVGIGEFVRSGTPLLDIEDLDHIEVTARVLPVEVASLLAAPGISLEFSGDRFELELDRVSPIVDKTTRTHEVRLRFRSRAAPIGASGRITWTEQNPGLPADLLVEREGKLGVFVIEGPTARFLHLEGAVEGRPVAIDVAPDTLIVTSGRHNLRPGDSVELEQ